YRCYGIVTQGFRARVYGNIWGALPEFAPPHRGVPRGFPKVYQNTAIATFAIASPSIVAHAPAAPSVRLRNTIPMTAIASAMANFTPILALSGSPSLA